MLGTPRWIPEYLPHWTSLERATAGYEFWDGGLVLRIDADQPDWSLEYDPTLRVSSLQVAARSGPMGSGDGQHRFQPGCLGALWLIGFEDSLENSGEICLFELFGWEAQDDRAIVRMGIRPHHDLA